MLWYLLFLGCNISLLAAVDVPPLMTKLLTDFNSKNKFTEANNCSAVRFEEWNVVVAKRYEIWKNRWGIAQNQCLRIDDKNPNHMQQYGPSGMGSSPHATEPLRNLLHNLFNDPTKNIKSHLDAPCGDFVWMQLVDVSKIVYLGGDITTVTINENNKCFAKPNVKFIPFDLTCSPIPEVDLMLTRDILFHLTDDVVMQILRRIGQSEVRYWLSTTFLTLNSDHKFKPVSYEQVKRGANSTIGYRDINLFDEPFCLPKPELKVREATPGNPRYVALWKLPFTVGECSNVKKLGRDAWASF